MESVVLISASFLLGVSCVESSVSIASIAVESIVDKFSEPWKA